MKRTSDIIIASLILLLLALPLMLIGLILRLSDGGPAFYRQPRVGLGGRIFSIVKFRSMAVNADRIGSYMTVQGDPRITPIGRILRRTSIDELPQLWNVVRGDMSLVGPRPDVPAQQAMYTPDDWASRHRMRPGITGLAQATSRSTGTMEERTKLDLHYVRHAGFWLDLKIIGMTLRQIVARTGN